MQQLSFWTRDTSKNVDNNVQQLVASMPSAFLPAASSFRQKAKAEGQKSKNKSLVIRHILTFSE